jgi:hypothetical protein
MDHAMTVGAQKTKVPGLCFIAWFQRVNGFGVMAFDEVFAHLNRKTARFAGLPPVSHSGKNFLRMSPCATRRPSVHDRN